MTYPTKPSSGYDVRTVSKNFSHFYQWIGQPREKYGAHYILVIHCVNWFVSNCYTNNEKEREKKKIPPA